MAGIPDELPARGWRHALVVATLLGLAACGQADSSDAAGVRASVMNEGALRNHVDRLGFQVGVPQGWQVDAQRLDNIIITDPDYLSFALIRPRAAGGNLAGWLRDGWPRTEGWITRVESAGAVADSPNVARGEFIVMDANGIRKRARVIAVGTGRGVATVFVAAAPVETFEADLPRLGAVLSSFRFGGPGSRGGNGAKPPGVQLSFIPYTDPTEYAFQTLVPQGWRTQGGLAMRGSSKLNAVTSTSPDGAVVAFLGLPGYIHYMFPSQTAISLGNPVGQLTSQDGGRSFTMMLPFQRAADVGMFQFQRTFGAARMTGATPRGDLVNEIRRTEPVMGGAQLHADAAEVSVQLQDGRSGRLVVTTSGQEAPGLGGYWGVNGLYGYIAPQGRDGEGVAAIAAMLGNYRVNPQWFAAQVQGARIDIKNYLDHLHASQAQQAQLVNQRWASDVQRQGAMGEILGGYNTVRGEDGRNYQAPLGSQFYYEVHNAQTPTAVGTNVDINPVPELDLRRMLRVGVEVAYDR
jgi:hypothetical protein